MVLARVTGATAEPALCCVWASRLLLIVVVMLPVAFAMTLMLAPVMFLVTWDIDALVPVILHEVDRLSACAVMTAVVSPFLRLARRHVQVNRRADDNSPCRSG